MASNDSSKMFDAGADSAKVPLNNESAATATDGGAAPSVFDKSGSIGKHFNADGSIGGTAQAVGGPFDKEGAIGKHFNADGAIGGTAQNLADKKQS